MLKQGRDLSALQKSFVLRALQEGGGARLDSRGMHEARQVSAFLDNDVLRLEGNAGLGAINRRLCSRQFRSALLFLEMRRTVKL
jgi:hypothetical protein